MSTNTTHKQVSILTNSLFIDCPITFENVRKIRNREELNNIEQVLPVLKDWLNTTPRATKLTAKALKLEQIIEELICHTNLLELTKMNRITKKEDRELYYVASRYLLLYTKTVLKAVNLKTHINFYTSIYKAVNLKTHIDFYTSIHKALQS